MAKQVLNNGETHGSIREKANDNFTELYNSKTDYETHKADNVTFYVNTTPSKLRFSAHRGCMDLAPENSLASFRLAGQLGAWGIETDTRVTSDGYIVCMHDINIDRTTDGTGNVSDLTFAQIQAVTIDTGSNIGNYSGSDLKIPTFDQYLKICKRYGCVALVHIQDQCTNSDIVAIVDMVVKHGMESSCVFQSWQLLQMQYVRSLNSKINVMVASGAINTDLLDNIIALKNSGLHIGGTGAITEEQIRYAHSNKMILFSSGETVSDRDYWANLGVDAITTSFLTLVNTPDSIPLSSEPIPLIFTDWELGTLVLGVNTDSNNRIRTAGFHAIPYGTKITFKPPNGYKMTWCNFDDDFSYVSQSSTWITDSVDLIANQPYFRFTLARVDSAGMTVSEAVNSIIIGTYTLESKKANRIQEPWIVPTLLNGWANAGGVGYMKDELGFVHLRGLLVNGTLNSTGFVLPVGYRPAYGLNILTISNNAIGKVVISTMGAVHIAEGGVGSNVWFSLDNIQPFRAEY